MVPLFLENPYKKWGLILLFVAGLAQVLPVILILFDRSYNNFFNASPQIEIILGIKYIAGVAGLALYYLGTKDQSKKSFTESLLVWRFYLMIIGIVIAIALYVFFYMLRSSVLPVS